MFFWHDVFPTTSSLGVFVAFVDFTGCQQTNNTPKCQRSILKTSLGMFIWYLCSITLTRPQKATLKKTLNFNSFEQTQESKEWNENAGDGEGGGRGRSGAAQKFVIIFLNILFKSSSQIFHDLHTTPELTSMLSRQQKYSPQFPMSSNTTTLDCSTIETKFPFCNHLYEMYFLNNSHVNGF